MSEGEKKFGRYKNNEYLCGVKREQPGGGYKVTLESASLRDAVTDSRETPHYVRGYRELASSRLFIEII